MGNVLGDLGIQKAKAKMQYWAWRGIVLFVAIVSILVIVYGVTGG